MKLEGTGEFGVDESQIICVCPYFRYEYVLDLRHHIRSGYSSVAGKLSPFQGCKLQG
jgi:hypothetical protein